MHAGRQTGCRFRRLQSQTSAASMTLDALRRESEHRASVEVSISDQMVIAADLRLKKFRTRWQRIVYDGPTARKDAESAERDRWIQLLANLLRSTDTPMGKLIRENPSNVQLLGGGSSRWHSQVKGTVCAKVSGAGWPRPMESIFPVHWRQLTEYLQVRYSEPCVRGSLKLVHSSYVFLQEVAGMEDRLTDSSMYAVALKELMSQAIPGKAPRQAPRFPTILLAAFEDISQMWDLSQANGHGPTPGSMRSSSKEPSRDPFSEATGTDETGQAITVMPTLEKSFNLNTCKVCSFIERRTISNNGFDQCKR